MKRYILLGMISLLMACGGGKEAITEKKVSEPVAPPKPIKKVVEPVKVSQDSLAALFAKKKPLVKKPTVVVQKKEAAKPVSKPKDELQPKVEVSTKGKPEKPEPQKIEKVKAEPVPMKAARVKELKPKPETKTEKPVIKLKPAEIKGVKEGAIVEKPEKIYRKEKRFSLLMQNIAFDDIFFDYAEWASPSLTFNSNYFITLSKLVKTLKSDPGINVRLKGYTDSAGSQKFNEVIAVKRATTIGKLILELFNKKDKPEVAQRIEIVGLGKLEPLIGGNVKTRGVLNRRVSIELTYESIEGTTLADHLKLSKRIVKAKPKISKKVHVIPRKVEKKIKSPRQTLYENASKFFAEERYDHAIAIYEELISIDPNSSLADNAQWWIGEALFFQKRYKEALTAYNKVFGLGDRSKEAYAQLRLGYCYLRLGEKQKAIEEFRNVEFKYPNAQEEIGKAQKKLRVIQPG